MLRRVRNLSLCVSLRLRVLCVKCPRRIVTRSAERSPEVAVKHGVRKNDENRESEMNRPKPQSCRRQQPPVSGIRRQQKSRRGDAPCCSTGCVGPAGLSHRSATQPGLISPGKRCVDPSGLNVNGCRARSPHCSASRSNRSGFTLIELLVTISIIALLMALILPAIQSAREASRRVTCANHLRNVALAVLNETESQKRFPAAAYWGGPDKNNPGPHHNWVVDILPWIDRRDLADRWNMDELLTSPGNRQLADTHIAVLTCPSDISVNGAGDLSFAVNGGIGESTLLNNVQDCIVDPFNHVLDLNGNGLVCVAPGVDEGTPSDRTVFKYLGLFFNENWGFETGPGYQGTVRHHRPDSVTDGMSNTLLLAENVRTGYDPYAGGSNWSSADSRRTKVYFSHRICASNVCSAGNVDLNRANSGDQSINSGKAAPEGEAPWPSSFHPGGVNVAFADGRVQFLSEGIDGRVYYSLFTPQGSRLQGTALDGGVSGDEY